MDVGEAHSSLNSLYNALVNEIEQIKDSYLQKYLEEKTLTPSEGWERDSKSCILLSHAVFENFLEVTAAILIEMSVRLYIYSGVTNEVLTNFIWLNVPTHDLFDDSTWNTSSKSVLISQLQEQKKAYLNFVNTNNHGIKVKNLNKLLRPVSLELPSNESSQNLEDLCQMRGKFAHRFLDFGYGVSKVKQQKGPEVIENIINGSNDVMQKIYNDALEKLIPMHLEKDIKTDLLCVLQEIVNMGEK